MAGQEIQDGLREDVVAIAGDHVPRVAHIGELDLREAREEFVGALLADQVTHAAANQKHGHAVAQDRVDGRVHAIRVGDLERGKRRGAADELRIPMPVPTIASAASSSEPNPASTRSAMKACIRFAPDCSIFGTMSTSTTALAMPGESSPASSIEVNPPREAPTSTGFSGRVRSTSWTSRAKLTTR